MKKITIPKKEEIIGYYITQAHTKEECCSFFSVSMMTFSRWLSLYGIKKDANGVRETIKQKYGSRENKEKIALEKRRQTCMEKYGVSNVMKDEGVCKTLYESNIRKYGVGSVLLSDSIKDKIKESNMRRYGYENPLMNPKVQEKIRENRMATYGVVTATQTHIQHPEIWLSDESLKEFLISCETKPSVKDLMKYFGISDVCVGSRIHKCGFDDLVDFRPSRSSYEKEIIDTLNTIGTFRMEFNDRTVLDGREIDIYLPEKRLGIEFNGDYWHSDIYHNDHGGRSTYHQEKSLLAEQNGVFLFHIYEHEWLNPSVRLNIINRLKTILGVNNIKVNGRECNIVELSKKQKQIFLDDNHIQGNDHSSICYGLVYHGDIVSCMSFVKPKNKKYSWELSRFCNKRGYNVRGGASKLFKHFLSIMGKDNDSIVSYNDITKTTGNLYRILGFDCVSINSPNYVWINFSSYDVRTRYQEQKAGETQRMHSLGYHRVCDCGTKTWVYKIKKGL